jgi:hypothetical protein
MQKTEKDVFLTKQVWHRPCTAALQTKGKNMADDKDIETLEMVLGNFIKEVESSSLSRHLLAVYEELGIEP